MSLIVLSGSVLGSYQGYAQVPTLSTGRINGQQTSGVLTITGGTSASTTTPYLELDVNSTTTNNGGKITYIAGDNTFGGAASNGVAHEFMIRPTWQSLGKIMRDGRVGFHLNNNAPPSWLTIGAGYTRVTVDDLRGVNLAAGCVGFNAAVQSDNAIGFKSTGTLNGGSLVWGDAEGGLNISTVPSGANGLGTGDQWLTIGNTTTAYRRMKIHPGGAVQIGRTQVTPSPHTDFKLAVDGKLVAQSVYVTQTNWADFVFAPAYTMLPLPALETYLRTNHHLPNVPSAAEVAADGVDLGAMDATLLRQIEELTLRLIALDKQNQTLATQLAALKQQMEQTAPQAPASTR